ncbi:hypothetical protein HYPDE_26853 [Hyphomicrobium denitrificans 1NES1]|uniref:Uncharacterized protein n=1 Tax=Hyphomicrobium denitrificans 1NES1 TaxID=670307 RepID=N0B958_9HYPH|nr:hypothetical protein [Hyphomicrobium denitrificans]AGK57051.1 hypothetical protein HYPDE_26853 [Hyphomicrobium denitrificans 1NES1]
MFTFISLYVLFRPFPFDMANLDSPPVGSFECFGTFSTFTAAVTVRIFLSHGRFRADATNLAAPQMAVHDVEQDGRLYAWSDGAERGDVIPARGAFKATPANELPDPIVECHRVFYLDPHLFDLPNNVHFESLSL